MKSRSNFSLACLLFLAFFSVYLRTLCSSVFPDDSGETATLAWTLGIGHPPGYPLHTLLARLFALLPLGDPGFRINLFAALLGALCAPLAFYLNSRRLNGIFAACLICLGPVFWHHATVAKGSIYMLNNLITLGCLLALGKKQLGIFWLLLGLGLAHHYMSQAVMLPCYGLLLAGARPWRKALAKSWLLLPGLSAYLYLPLRSALNPAINWSEISSLGDFFFFFARAQYSGGEFSRSLAISLQEAGSALKDWFGEGHGIAALLALYGLWQFRHSREKSALASAVILPLLGASLYLNLSAARLEIMQPYLFPAYLATALLAAAALERARAWALPLWICLALLPALHQWQLQDKSKYYYAIDAARNQLSCLPRNSVFFCSGDAVIFPIWYLQNVKHEREDVAVVGEPLLAMDWVRDGLQRRYPALRQPRVFGTVGAESTVRLVSGLLEMNKGRLPLYFSYNQMDAGVPWSLLPQGPVYLALPPGGPERQGAMAKAKANLDACVTRGFERRPLDSLTLKLMIGDFAVHHNSLGRYLEDYHKDYAGALAEYQAAAYFDPANTYYPFNCGNALYRLGRYSEAAACYQKALALDPGNADARSNLAASRLVRHSLNR